MLMNTNSRTMLPVAQLYAILDREFRSQRPRACKDCYVPLPYWCRPPDDVSANWFIGTPRECQHGCHVLIAEILAGLWSRYDIDRSPMH